MHWAETWYYLVTKMFLQGYYENVGENDFIPTDEEDTEYSYADFPA